MEEDLSRREENKMEQTYVIENCKSFNARDIFECGQCFRWNVQEDGSYTGIFGKNVLNVKQEPTGKVIITGICDGDIKEVCRKYFDLDRDYEAIKEKLANIDEYMKESIKYGEGIRILNQDLWEMIISFIVSANNNIPRIKGIIDRMSKKYGICIVFRGQEYYTFPTPEALATASMEDLRALGLGFRDKYIFETTRKIVNGEVDLEKLKQEKSTKNIRNELLTLSGVGPKVADCILLFSTLKRFDVFPIDVWVRRVMNDLYIHNPVEAKVNKKEIEQLAKEKGTEYLHEKLREVDPKSAENIHANNVKRVIRALEFYHQNGTPISEHNEEQKQQTSPYNLAYFVMIAPREILYERIDRRVDQMMEEGLLEEVKSLRERGCHRGMVSMQGLGYKEILAYLEGEYPLEEAVRILKRDTRHFAKRQLTWFRREQDVIWVDKEQFHWNEAEILEYMMSVLKERDLLG